MEFDINDNLKYPTEVEEWDNWGYMQEEDSSWSNSIERLAVLDEFSSRAFESKN